MKSITVSSLCISALLLLVSSAVMAQDSLTAAGKYSAGTNPGVVSYTFRNEFQKDVPGTLDTIKKYGITNIEFSNLFGKTSTELRNMLDARGMVCTSYGVSYPDLVNNTDKVGENARTLGASYVRVAWIPHEDSKGFTIDDAVKTVADFNKAGKLLKETYGITFCYHNHGYEFARYGDGTFFDYLVKNTNPDYVSFELDILWAFHPGANPAELIKKYPTRFKLMHVKDLRKGITGDLSGKTPVENDVALGTGQLNLPQILKAAQSSSIQYYYIEDESNSVRTQLPLSLGFLHKWLKKK